MLTIYNNNTEIVEFVNKAQNKIADLSTLLVERGGNLPSALYLLLELSDFVEMLDDDATTWSINDTLKYIQGYNHRANLGSISFLLMTGVEVNIILGGAGISLPIQVRDISDFSTGVNTVITQFPHNNLNSIQPVLGYPGYNPAERYHLNKDMYDKLFLLTYPYTAPTVTINAVASSPNNIYGFYELGTAVTDVVLQGGLTLNSGKSILSYRYLKNGNGLSSVVNTPLATSPINTYTDSNITVDSVYVFEADFEDGGIKTASTSIIFKQPMFYGVNSRNLVSITLPSSQSAQYTKVIRDRGQMDLTFTMPTGNSLITNGTEIVPVVVFPRAWGNPTSANVGVYPFINDWTFTNTTMVGALGTLILDTITGVFYNAVTGPIEQTVTFTFDF